MAKLALLVETAVHARGNAPCGAVLNLIIILGPMVYAVWRLQDIRIGIAVHVALDGLGWAPESRPDPAVQLRADADCFGRRRGSRWPGGTTIVAAHVPESSCSRAARSFASTLRSQPYLIATQRTA